VLKIFEKSNFKEKHNTRDKNHIGIDCVRLSIN